MLELVSRLRRFAPDRATAVTFAAIALLSLPVLWIAVPAPARASGCSDSWTNPAGGSWFAGSNWSKGSPPSASDEACIILEGTYTVTMAPPTGSQTEGFTFEVHVGSLTVGGAPGVQTLALDSGCIASFTELKTSGGTNVASTGAVTMSDGEGCAKDMLLAGPVSNAGRIAAEPGNGGRRFFEGDLTNTGTLAINTIGAVYASFSVPAGATLQNHGAINIAAGARLIQSGGGATGTTLVNGSGGTIAASGTGELLVGGLGVTFTQDAGTTSGTPVTVDGALINYTGAGQSTIRARDAVSLSGNLAAGQQLSIESTCGGSATTTAAASFANAGSISLSSAGCGFPVSLVWSGTLSNSGTITTHYGDGGQRRLAGNLTNTGTLALNGSTSYNGSSSALINEGAINISAPNSIEGGNLFVGNKSSVTNAAGGSIADTGPSPFGGTVRVSPGSSFTEGAGTTSGAQPVIVDGAALNYTGSGESLIRLRGSGSLSGNLASSQSLSIESTCSENAVATAAVGFTNAGAITLTNGDSCAKNATLAVSSGTLSNSGTIASQLANGGERTLQGNLTNTGTLAVNWFLSYNGAGAALINRGAITLASPMTVSNAASVTNGAGGSIAGTGFTPMHLRAGSSFTEEAGTTSGSEPVIVEDGTLNYTGSGASLITLWGSDALSGSLASGQSLSIESICNKDAVATAVTGFTNAGAITLTNADSCAGNATLAVSSGTLTNSGTITTQPASGGERALQGSLTNTGTLAINANTAYSTATSLVNRGAINIGSGVALSAPNKPTISNQTGGTIAGGASGQLLQTGGTFTEELGKTTGIRPVVLDDLGLNYTGNGSSTIGLRGASTLSGNISAGQVLSLESTCSEDATVAVKGLLTLGTLNLANGDGCARNATLNLEGGTLEDMGTVRGNRGAGGIHSIEGNLINDKLVSLAVAETLKVTGSYTQAKSATLKTEVAGASNFGLLSVAGPASLNGTVALTQLKPFNGSLGQSFEILTTSSRTGTFLKEKGGVIKKSLPGLYYKPIYSPTGVALSIAQATVAVTPAKAPAGSTVTLSGSGFPAEDTVKLSFMDHAKVRTVLTSVTTNAGGEFSVEVKVPSGAASGAGKFTARGALTAVAPTAAFTVG